MHIGLVVGVLIVIASLVGPRVLHDEPEYRGRPALEDDPQYLREFEDYHLATLAVAGGIGLVSVVEGVRLYKKMANVPLGLLIGGTFAIAYAGIESSILDDGPGPILAITGVAFLLIIAFWLFGLDKCSLAQQDDSVPRTPSGLLNRWYAPHVALLVTGAIGLSLAMLLANSMPSCRTDDWPLVKERDVLLTLLPTLVDLLPLLWLVSRLKQVRIHAAVSGGMGLVRCGLPIAIVVRSLAIEDKFYLGDNCSGYDSDFLGVFVLMLYAALWLVTAAIAILLARVTLVRSWNPARLVS